MTSRERVQAAIEHRHPDRVPLDLWARPEVWDALQAHFGVTTRNAARQRLGIDIVNIGVEFEDPAFAARVTTRIPGQSTMSGRLAVDYGDGAYTDQWGVRYELDAGQQVERIVAAPLAKPDAAGYAWPSPDGIESAASLTHRIAALHDEGFCVFASILNPFKQAWQLRGFEDFLIDLYTAPAFALDFMERLGEYAIEMGRRLADAGADVIMIVGDVAMQDRMLFGRDRFAELLAPVFRRIIAAVRERRRVPFMFHSDGDIMPILGELADAGFEIVNPIQPECMDPVEAKRRYGDLLTLHGTISVQTLLPRGTETEVRATVRRMIDECGRDGGLILSTTNDAMTDIPLDNLLALYDEARLYSAQIRGKKRA